MALNVPLELNKDALKLIEDKYSEIYRKGISKTDQLLNSRKKMAFIPRGAEPIFNPIGTAPAIKFIFNEITVFCLPGVPSELKAIFENTISPYIKNKNGGEKFFEKTIKIEGIVESELAEHIERIMKEVENVYIKTHPQGYEGIPRINIHITSSGNDEILEYFNKAVKKIEKVIFEMGGKIL